MSDYHRGRHLIRVLMLLRLCLAGRHDTLEGFARTLGVCTRTVRRDFYVLEAAGFAVRHAAVSDEGRNGGVVTWWILRSSDSHRLRGNQDSSVQMSKSTDSGSEG